MDDDDDDMDDDDDDMDDDDDDDMDDDDDDDDGIPDLFPVPESEILELQEKARDVKRAPFGSAAARISFGRKMCPTRHGCQGATYCNRSYSDYG